MTELVAGEALLRLRGTTANTLDCTASDVRASVNDAFDALPFLGALTCGTTRLVAGETTELLMEYVVGASGIADSGWLKLCFKYYSDWDLQTERPGERDYVSAELVRAGVGMAPGVTTDGTARELRVRYDHKGGERPYQKAVIVDVVDGFLRPGDRIVVRLGDRRFGGPGTRVQTFVEHGFAFLLHVDTLGTSRMARAGEHRLDIVAGQPARLVARGPRLVRAGQGSPLRAHLEDAWGNACVPVGGSITASWGDGTDGSTTADLAAADPAGGAAQWATALLRLPALPEGHVDVRVEAGGDGLPSGLETTVPVHTLLAEAPTGLPGARAYFADLHVHSDDTVGTQDTPWNLAYGRDVGGLDVLGYTANDFQVTDDAWAATVAECRTTETEDFVCYPGVEWCGNAGAGGDHNVVYLGEDTTLARSLQWREGMTSDRPVPETWPITRVYDAYAARPEDYLMIPHVGGRRGMLNWHHPDLERLIEVHSTWGTSAWYFEEALRRGLRLGVSAASDEHRGRPGSGAPGANIFGGRGGLTGVLAPELEHGAVARALRDRRTWATTGARAVGLLRSGEHWMGDDVTVAGPTTRVDAELYADGVWEEVSVLDGAGVLMTRDLHREVGYDDQLVRLRWGGARHLDRYRWASWAGRVAVGGTTLLDASAWATLDPEATLARDGDAVDFSARTYGADTGVVLRLADLSAALLEIQVGVREDGTSEALAVKGAELLEHGRIRFGLGGAGLHLTVERVADPARLPVEVSQAFAVAVPEEGAAVYVRARQWDGQQLWTSPLFLARG